MTLQRTKGMITGRWSPFWLRLGGGLLLLALLGAASGVLWAQEGDEFDFTGAVVGTAPNCGLTEVRGRVLDADGSPLANQRVRVRELETAFSDGEGNWSVLMDQERSRDGTWQVRMVDETGRQTSNELTVTTQEKPCAPDSDGVQSVFIDFRRRTPAPPPPPPPLFYEGRLLATEATCLQTEIRGRIVDAQGWPVPGLRVWVSKNLSTPSDAEGRWGIMLSAEESLAGLWELFLLDPWGNRVSNKVEVFTQREPCAPGSGGVQRAFVEFQKLPEPTPPPVTPTPTPIPKVFPFQFKGDVVGTEKNCGITEIRGAILDRDGTFLNGHRVRVQWTTGFTISVPSGEEGRNDGLWDVVLDDHSKDAHWEVWMVDATGQVQLSDKLVVRSTEDCTSDRAVNTIRMDFRRVA